MGFRGLGFEGLGLIGLREFRVGGFEAPGVCWV